jgi:MAGUK p55 subfamily protein 5
MIAEGREMEDAFGHYFDHTITNSNLERTFNELLQLIDRIEREPQWSPASWVR